MSSCQSIIRRAYRKANILAAGVNMNAMQTEIGLEHLQAMYRGLITGGMFGRPRDVFVDTATYTAEEYQRVFLSVPGTVTLPSTIDDRCTGKKRQPRDFAFICVVDPVSHTSTYNIYDRGTATWTDLNSLVLTQEAPLSGRYEDHVIALLAMRMLGDSDMPIPVELTREAARARLALANRYDDARVTGVGEFS